MDVSLLVQCFTVLLQVTIGHVGHLQDKICEFQFYPTHGHHAHLDLDQLISISVVDVFEFLQIMLPRLQLCPMRAQFSPGMRVLWFNGY